MVRWMGWYHQDGRSGASRAPVKAFPNAYVSTDELPRRSLARRLLCLAAIGGLGYLGLVILLLSLFWSGYNPVTQVASDYGVGAFASEMNSGFFVAGVGMVALAAAVYSSAKRASVKVGTLLLVPSGVALIVNAFYPTDVEGAVKTFHGFVHGTGGAVFFFTAPLGLLLVSRGFGRQAFLLLVVAVFLAILSLALPPVLGLDAGGLGERILIMVVFSSAILTAAATYRRS